MAISKLTIGPSDILVVDNASTDGTGEWLHLWLPVNLPQATFFTMETNTGGAGGFHAGLKKACADGASWVWMMDDDACPHPKALEELLNIAQSPLNLYGSLAVNGPNTAWSTMLRDEGKTTLYWREVPEVARVDFIPFLGILIHRSLVKKIGYPDADYFIAADDVEYCLRARRAGADIIIAGKSHIEHPRTQRHTLKLLRTEVVYLRLPPWKRYYDTRNRLLIAREYYGIRLLTQTIPGSFVRLIAAVCYEPRKLAQLGAFCAGMIDGLLGIKGRRHERWRIRQ